MVDCRQLVLYVCAAVCQHCLSLRLLLPLRLLLQWRAAVEARMDELVAQQRERQAHTAAERPRDKNAEVALKFL